MARGNLSLAQRMVQLRTEGNPVYGAAIQLLSHLGAVPRVVDLGSVVRPLSDRQIEIAFGVLAGATKPTNLTLIRSSIVL